MGQIENKGAEAFRAWLKDPSTDYRLVVAEEARTHWSKFKAKVKLRLSKIKE